MLTGDDAAVYRLSDETAIVQTVDFFPPMVDDPRAFGEIAAANALSDIYATGAKPLTALNIVAFPSDQPKEVLREILRGGAEKAKEAGCLIVGGHTISDKEPKYGMAVTGIVEPGKQLTNDNAQAGDALVLTKPLGTGAITSAAKAGQADPEVLRTAIRHMVTLNRAAAEAAMEVGSTACTDVTGFSLLGHLRGMAQASGVGATIFNSKVPLIPGAYELAVERGLITDGTNRNREYLDECVTWSDGLPEDLWKILYDPQTSGGLLLSVPQAKADELVRALHGKGVTDAVIVGKITSDNPGVVHVSS